MFSKTLIHTMGINAVKVSIDKTLSYNLCIVFGHAIADEDLSGKAFCLPCSDAKRTNCCG